MLRYSFVLMAGMLAAGPALAGSWADALFVEFSKDFGSVPRGPELNHYFRIKNTTNGVVTISGVRVSCGLCGWAQVQKGQLNPGEETTVHAKMLTRNFEGPKTVYVYVQFLQPQFDEVQLSVQCNSRSDVSLTPEAMAFGHSRRGDTPKQSATLTMYGNNQAQVTGVDSESNYVMTEYKEVARTDSEVSYQVTARLRSDTPPGRWFTDLWVKTNNPSIPRVRVPLTMEIESPLSISPALVSLGEVKVGEAVEKKVIVRGGKAFAIKGIKGAGNSLQVSDSVEGQKEVHVLTVRLKAAKPGAIAQTLRVVTDLKEEGEIEFQARAEIVK